jgi:hypothetical protein
MKAEACRLPQRSEHITPFIMGIAQLNNDRSQVVIPITFLCLNFPPHCSCLLQYGEEAIKEGMGGGGPSGGMADIFDMMMGGGGRGRPARERKSEDVVHQMQVTLEEMYNGATK